MKASTHTRPAASRPVWRARIAAAILAVSGLHASGQAFTPGNLVVLQEANGNFATAAAGNQVVLDQFTTAGTLVSAISIPTNGPSALVQNGTSITEGFINLTPDGRELVFPGYNVSYGYTNATLSSATATAIPRAVATVDVNGNYSLATNCTAFYGGANIRSAASDGNFNFWAEGSAGGMTYMGLGTQTNITGTVLNSRVIQMIGGTLCYSTGSDKRGIIQVTGAPMAGPATTNYIIPTGTYFNSTVPSPYAFVFNPAMTVCYVADSTTYTNSQTIGGVEKWTNNGSGAFVFAYTLQPGPAGNTNGAVGLAVSFGATTNIYGTLANNTNLFAITDTGAASAGTILYSCPTTQALRGVCFAPTNGTTPAAAVISRINPPSQTVYVGSTVALTAIANVGAPGASNLWYCVTNSVTNLIAGVTGTTLTMANVQTNQSGRYFVVMTNSSGNVTSKVATLSVVYPYPIITGITPTNAIVNAGQPVLFSLAGSFGSPAASNYWYFSNGSTTNFLASQTSTTLTLNNVVAANSGSYFAILSNSFGLATSPIAMLIVTNDPTIEVEPSSVEGLLDGAIQFSVTAAGSSPLSYQWYYTDGNGNLLSGVANGNTTPSGLAIISGAASNLLTIANLQNADVTSLTNLAVVVTNVYGAVTSSVASILAGTNAPGVLPVTGSVLALWDFDGPQFTNYAVNPNCVLNPAPFIGSGTARPVGSTFNPPATLSLANISSTAISPFSGATDPGDVGFDPVNGGYIFTPYGFEQPSPNFSWGTGNYPAVTGTNLQNGIQFNVSTAGARNIHVNYDARVSSTASEYHRLQYTTNGATWVNYPASSSFDGLSGSGNAGYYPFSYDLTGFPGVDNNPNFGVRIVTEWQSTATYQVPPGEIASPFATNNVNINGQVATNFWIGVANSYTSGASGNAAAGTFTFDLVAVRGDAITNNNAPPILGSFAAMPVTNGLAFTNMIDTNTLVLNFSAASAQMAATNLTFTVQPVGTVSAASYSQTVIPSTAVNSLGGTNFQLSLSFPTPIPDANDAAPIEITATDTNGLSASSWFLLTVGSINQPPTNSLTGLHSTNMLVNTPIVIPFTVGSIRDPYTNLTFSVASDNNSVIPAPANIVVTGDSNSPNRILTISPATNLVGDAVINVTVSDNDPVEPRGTTATIALFVAPNTNVIAGDYFNYDTSGALDTQAQGYWQHLSGLSHQLQETSASPGGYATISGGNTENIQAGLRSSPYTTNSGVTLYYSMGVNVPPGGLPTGNGTYITAFNDGSGNTANVEDCLVVATNGAASGFYRLGIASFVGATALNARMFPQDLSPGVNYFIVTALSLNNGHSTLWVSPTNQSSASVTDTTATTLYNLSQFELRESGSVEGSINVGATLAGLSFDSVFYPAQANLDIFGVTENTTNVLNPLLNDGGWALNITSVYPDGNETVTTTGTNITFIPNTGFTGMAVVGCIIQDNLGNTSSNNIAVAVTNNPPLAVPDAYTVLPNSVNNMLNPLTNDILETPGGALSLTSVSETDGNGAATPSGNQVLFTPTSNFTGTASIGYTIADGLGGTGSSTITVTVFNPTPVPLGALLVNNTNLVLSWTNSLFNLQSSTNVAGPYVTIPAATSPFTNLTTTNATRFFRLVH